MVALYLAGHKIPVRTASNAFEALDAVRTSPPALILLDLMMPQLSGESFRRFLSADPRLAAIPIVVVSASPTSRRGVAAHGRCSVHPQTRRPRGDAVDHQALSTDTLIEPAFECLNKCRETAAKRELPTLPCSLCLLSSPPLVSTVGFR